MNELKSKRQKQKPTMMKRKAEKLHAKMLRQKVNLRNYNKLKEAGIGGSMGRNLICRPPPVMISPGASCKTNDDLALALLILKSFYCLWRSMWACVILFCFLVNFVIEKWWPKCPILRCRQPLYVQQIQIDPDTGYPIPVVCGEGPAPANPKKRTRLEIEEETRFAAFILHTFYTAYYTYSITFPVYLPTYLHTYLPAYRYVDIIKSKCPRKVNCLMNHVNSGNFQPMIEMVKWCRRQLDEKPTKTERDMLIRNLHNSAVQCNMNDVFCEEIGTPPSSLSYKWCIGPSTQKLEVSFVVLLLPLIFYFK
jgi:hypothetical protein